MEPDREPFVRIEPAPGGRPDSSGIDIAIPLDVPFEFRRDRRAYVLYWLSRSALPPKPPIRSSAGDERRIRASSSRALSSWRASDRVFASRAISFRDARAGCRSSGTPGRAVACTTNTPEISQRYWNGGHVRRKRFVVDERLLKPRRQTVAEDRSASHRARHRPERIAGGLGQARYTPLLRDAVHGVDDLLAGRESGYSGAADRAEARVESQPRYLPTSRFASAGSTSPAITSVALRGT